jgi:hypothetical protein
MVKRRTITDDAKLANLMSTYGLTYAQIRAVLSSHQDQTSVPMSIFQTAELSPLEAITKYLKENRQLRLSQIAVLIGRDQREVGVTYHRAKRKMAEPIVELHSPYRLPLALLNDRTLSVFEHAVKYLTVQYGLKLHEIATLTTRDQRTIWTVAQRVKQKER